MGFTVDIDNDIPRGFIVYFSDDSRRPENYDDYKADTLAEAYLWIAKQFHQLGLAELQERINAL